MNILGLSAFYHDASCCLLRDGVLTAAAAEERFSRKKHDAGMPEQAFRFCLEQGGLDIADLDAIAYYENPDKKRARQLWAGRPGESDTQQVERLLRERLGFEGPVLFFDHHRSHAASAFFFSGMEEAAIFTIDGVGEWATTAYGYGRGNTLDLFEEVLFPHSLGLLYATITAYLGFRVNDGEYKVMGLAPYGKPRFTDQLGRLLENCSEGQFRLDTSYFDFMQGSTMYSDRLCELLGQAPRPPESALTDFHCDVARSLQVVLENILLDKARWLLGRTGAENLCLAGGVALNGVAIGKLRRSGIFKNLYIPPDPGDGGACLGAAALAHIQLGGRRPDLEPLQQNYLGPAFSNTYIRHVLDASGLPYLDFEGREAELLEVVVDKLLAKQVVGWFQGGMEFGPRALGARSILAHPSDPDMREQLNKKVKKRETFRPFAPSVLASEAARHFELDHASPFMLETCAVRSPLDLPAITHIDGSARPQTVTPEQNPRFHALLEIFYRRSGVPMLVNTSFNVRDEPIVCTPADALFGLVHAELDVLVIGDFMIDRAQIPVDFITLCAGWQRHAGRRAEHTRNPLGENLYSFV